MWKWISLACIWLSLCQAISVRVWDPFGTLCIQTLCYYKSYVKEKRACCLHHLPRSDISFNCLRYLCMERGRWGRHCAKEEFSAESNHPPAALPSLGRHNTRREVLRHSSFPTAYITQLGTEELPANTYPPFVTFTVLKKEKCGRDTQRTLVNSDVNFRMVTMTSSGRERQCCRVASDGFLHL